MHTFAELKNRESSDDVHKKEVEEKPLIDPRIYDSNIKIEVDENDPISKINSSIADRMEELFALWDSDNYIAGCKEEKELQSEIDRLMEQSLQYTPNFENNSDRGSVDDESEIKIIIEQFLHGNSFDS